MAAVHQGCHARWSTNHLNALRQPCRWAHHPGRGVLETNADNGGVGDHDCLPALTILTVLRLGYLYNLIKLVIVSRTERLRFRTIRGGNLDFLRAEGGGESEPEDRTLEWVPQNDEERPEPRTEVPSFSCFVAPPIGLRLEASTETASTLIPDENVSTPVKPG